MKDSEVIWDQVTMLKPWEDQDKAKAFIEMFADDGEQSFCPRCGQHRMNPVKVKNALSRYANVYICSECGEDEALRDYYDEQLPLNNWRVVKMAKKIKVGLDSVKE